MATVRSLLETEPQILTGCPQVEKERWVEALDEMVSKRSGSHAVTEFHRWIAETYTHVPADRPNWEGYEMFFFHCSVGMREDDDWAGCFEDGRAVYQAYDGFVRARRIDLRIEESRSRCHVRSLCFSIVLGISSPAPITSRKAATLGGVRSLP